MSATQQILRWGILAFSFAIAACSSGSRIGTGTDVSETPRGDPVLGYRIAEGTVFDGKLWLRGGSGIYPRSTGGLVSFQLSDWSRVVVFKSDVIDIERSRDTLWALHHASGSRGAIALTAWKNGASYEFARFNPSRNDQPIALLVNGDNPLVVTQQSIRTWVPETRRWRVTRLRGNLQSASGFAVNSSVGMPMSGRAIYVGYDAGEWGGGMQRMDIETGEVTRVQKCDESRRYFYGGPLCSDPVTGIIPDPTRANCVLASTGLVHLGVSSGRVVRICGAEVDVAFENVEEIDFPAGKFAVSEAFFGLAPASDAGYWAIGILGLYRFSPTMSEPMKNELPHLMPMDQIYLSRDIADAIILRTDINAAVSTSGYTPLVVPLDRQ